MVNKVILFLISLALFSCASSDFSGDGFSDSPDSPDSFNVNLNENFWLTLPEPGFLTIIGVSGPRLRPELEISAAREDAARRASMFHHNEVIFKSSESTGSGFFNYFVQSETTIFYDTDLEPYMEVLTFDPERDVIRSGNSICIRFSYPLYLSGFPRPFSIGSADPDERPEWISRPPSEIGPFLAGVGFARRQQRLSDTIMRSTESAAAALISRVSALVTDRIVTVDQSSAIFSRQESRGSLTNFLLLEIWIDPVTQDVWTLAIAQ